MPLGWRFPTCLLPLPSSQRFIGQAVVARSLLLLVLRDVERLDELFELLDIFPVSHGDQLAARRSAIWVACQADGLHLNAEAVQDAGDLLRRAGLQSEHPDVAELAELGCSSRVGRIECPIPSRAASTGKADGERYAACREHRQGVSHAG